MGPTASGKSGVSLPLSKLLDAEIISVDSALVYQQMDIGTAKPTTDILQQYPHHLIDILDPAETYSAADFVSDTIRCIEQIHARNKIPLLVGGTMMYFNALQQGLANLPNADDNLRQQLRQRLQAEGHAVLHQELTQVDPEAAQRIHQNDPQRLLRALEVYHATGTPLSTLQQQTQRTEQYHFINHAIIPADREQLHQRIAQRFQDMLATGFIDEMSALYQRKDLHADLPSMRSVGYRQGWQYCAGQIDINTMRELAITATRQLAKRQYTWLRSWQNCYRYDLTGVDCVRAIYEQTMALKVWN